MKVTFATLKKYAKQGILYHTIKNSYSGMIDGLEKVDDNLNRTTIDDLDRFKVTKNYLKIEDGFIKLSNCCFRVIFSIRYGYVETFNNIKRS